MFSGIVLFENFTPRVASNTNFVLYEEYSFTLQKSYTYKRGEDKNEKRLRLFRSLNVGLRPKPGPRTGRTVIGTGTRTGNDTRTLGRDSYKYWCLYIDVCLYVTPKSRDDRQLWIQNHFMYKHYWPGVRLCIYSVYWSITTSKRA